MSCGFCLALPLTRGSDPMGLCPEGGVSYVRQSGLTVVLAIVGDSAVPVTGCRTESSFKLHS